MISRRDLLKLGGLAGLGAVGTAGLGGCGSSSDPDQTGQLLRSGADLPTPFTLPLKLPAVLSPTERLSDGSDLYRVTSRTAEVEILPGRRTAILGYQGTFPGPTIETRRDRAVAVEHVPVTPAVANIIRKGELQTLPTAIQSGREAGMIPLERSLAKLAESGAVSPQAIKKIAADHDLLASLSKR
jgi:hypothetical protein